MEADTALPTCYRHPDRETRLACSTCGRPACVDCVRSAPVGQKCVDCSRPQHGAAEVAAGPTRGRAGQGAPFSFAVLGVCVALFALGLASPELAAELRAAGAQDNHAVAGGQWYRLFTAAFLHADLTHILFNMLALYLFGPQLEREAGSAPFAALYLGAALAGGAAFYLVGGPGVAVGASGAIFGLFGAWLAVFFRNRHSAAGRAGFRQLLTLLAINTALPLLIPNIAWQAHAGGLAAGVAVAAVWTASARGGRGRSPALWTLVGAAVGALALALVLLG